MFRKFVIAVIIAVAAILETAADAIAATLPPPAADSPRLRVVAGLCLLGALPFRPGGEGLPVAERRDGVCAGTLHPGRDAAVG